MFRRLLEPGPDPTIATHDSIKGRDVSGVPGDEGGGGGGCVERGLREGGREECHEVSLT